MANPQDNFFNLGVGLNTEPTKAAAKEIDNIFDDMVKHSVDKLGDLSKKEEELAKTLKLVGEEAKKSRDSVISLSGVLKEMGAIASRALGVVGAALMAPASLDNYLGKLNSKITQTNGLLLQYGSTFNRLRGNISSTSMAFGMSSSQLEQTMMGFATGATNKEKGAGFEQRFAGMLEGAGGLVRGLGFDPTQATMALTELHKSIGLAYGDMGDFAKQSMVVGKAANMSSTQLFSMTMQVSKLAKAYGLSGEAGHKFVVESMAAGAALSQLGLDAESVLNRMNEVSTGSEQGLIQSLILGFKPGDVEGQMKSFQNQARMIVGMASSLGPQLAPFMIKQLAGPLQMGSFSVEEIQRLAAGGTLDKKEDAVGIFKEIRDNLKDPSKNMEGRYNTFLDDFVNIVNKWETMLTNLFFNPLQDLKQFMQNKVPGIIKSIEGFIKKIDEFISSFTGQHNSLMNLLAGAGLLAAVPTILKLGGGFIEGIGKSVGGAIINSMIASAGGLGAAIGGALLATGVGAILGASVAGVLLKIAEMIDKNANKKYLAGVEDQISDAIKHQASATTDREKVKWGQIAYNAASDPLASNILSGGMFPEEDRKTLLGHALGKGKNYQQTFIDEQNKAIFGTTGTKKSTGGVISFSAEAIKKASGGGGQSDIDSLSALGAEFGFTGTPGGKDAAHRAGKAMDFSVRGKSREEQLAFIAAAKAKGLFVQDEVAGGDSKKIAELKKITHGKWTGDNIHVATASNASLAQKATEGQQIGIPTTSGTMNTVHDHITNETLQGIAGMLASYLPNLRGGSPFDPATSVASQ